MLRAFFPKCRQIRDKNMGRILTCLINEAYVNGGLTSAFM